MNYCTSGTGGARLAYEVYGEGKVELAIEMGLMSCIAEWRHVARGLGKTALLYERAGMDKSDRSTLPRTPENIAKELRSLLECVPHEDRLILLAHSQGGLYAQQFARMYPDMVRGIILLDPLSANDSKFKELLTPEEYRQGGVDKSGSLGISRTLAKLHLGCVIRSAMKNAPPMYYYDFTPEDRREILNALSQATAYETALEEYRLSHDAVYTDKLTAKDGFPRVPLALITHSSELSVREIMEFGRASRETAEKVEGIWQSLMKEYLAFSDISRFTQSGQSTHYIHLSDPQQIKNAIEWIDGQ